MKDRIFLNSFIASVVASAIALIIGNLVSFYFWVPVVLPAKGWVITGAGMFAVPFVIYLVIYLPMIHFLNKKL